ncbi:DUF6090 family protein [Croceiramulus getboli]|nr:DUF6090 family protein [Flavobacteriaceae bacterium YJPT1-3]
MIKFFRKIRQRLLAENKFSKYLLYGIGEIVLVVIGILIALQINTWNENRKSKALAQKYIQDIRTDLVNDTLTYTAALQRLEKTIAKNTLLANPEVTAALPLDSLNALLANSFHSIRIYKIDNTTYLKLSNTGFLETGHYADLFKAVNTYYNKEYTSYSEYIEWDEEQSVDMFHPDFLGSYKNTVLLSNEQPNEMEVENFRAFIASKEFRNRTTTNQTRKSMIVDKLRYQKALALELMEKIDGVLER